MWRLQGDGYDTDYHPAELHPANAENSEEHAQQEKEKEPAAEKDNEKPSTDAKHSEGMSVIGETRAWMDD